MLTIRKNTYVIPPIIFMIINLTWITNFYRRKHYQQKLCNFFFFLYLLIAFLIIRVFPWPREESQWINVSVKSLRFRNFNWKNLVFRLAGNNLKYSGLSSDSLLWYQLFDLSIGPRKNPYSRKGEVGRKQNDYASARYATQSLNVCDLIWFLINKILVHRHFVEYFVWLFYVLKNFCTALNILRCI